MSAAAALVVEGFFDVGCNRVLVLRTASAQANRAPPATLSLNLSVMDCCFGVFSAFVFAGFFDVGRDRVCSVGRRGREDHATPNRKGNVAGPVLWWQRSNRAGTSTCTAELLRCIHIPNRTGIERKKKNYSYFNDIFYMFR